MFNFDPFAEQVQQQFQALQNAQDVFVSALSGDALYATYLQAFPEGTNPTFRERTEFDCGNCKGFIRNFGGALTIDPVTLEVATVWDGSFDYPFDVVAARMREAVIGAGVGGLLRVTQPTFSAPRSVALRPGTTGETETFVHLHGVAGRRFVTGSGQAAGEYATAREMLRGALDELTLDALDTTLDLIRDRQLYRGEQMEGPVKHFAAAARRAAELTGEARERFIAVTALNQGVARFRNVSIGELVANLSGGMDLTRAVAAYESMVAPQNYQRTSQVVSQRMIDDALATIKRLDVRTERRLARLSDVSITNVLWVDNSSRPAMKGGLEGLLDGAATKRPVTVPERQVTEVGIQAFLDDVLPRATGLRVLVEPDLKHNFMTLTTAREEGGAPLFAWNNPVAWSYSGNVTDTITERVKTAGGNVAALLRFSLAWSNSDDLDLHVRYTGPGGQEEIYYAHKTAVTPGLRGSLDVDMNAFSITRDPVENVAFTSLLPGRYQVSVRNFNQRERRAAGFTLQVASAAGTQNYTHAAAVDNKRTVACLTATVDRAGHVTFDVAGHMTPDTGNGEKWGVPFGQYADVHCVMLSPNHWDGQACGNRHWFFLLKDARTDEQPRGIYNEYLHPDLRPHRRTFDVIGERSKIPLDDQQLSGIGVSSTLRKTVIAEVTTDTSRRTYRVNF